MNGDSRYPWEDPVVWILVIIILALFVWNLWLEFGGAA